MDPFHCRQGDGILWLHGYGNVFEKVLAPGEQFDVEPGSWLFKEPGVRMATTFQRLSTGIFAGMNLALNRFTGWLRLRPSKLVANVRHAIQTAPWVRTSPHQGTPAFP